MRSAVLRYALAAGALLLAVLALLGGFLDLRGFIAICIAGLAVAWWSMRRRQSEAALRESEGRYERAVNASDDGFWEWIPRGDKVYASPRLKEIYGLAPDATFAGREDLVAHIPFHPEDRQQTIQGFAEHLAGETARYKVEVRLLLDGETRWVQLAGFAARDSSGTVVRWTGTVRDITERKRAEEALRESEHRYELAMAASASGHWDWDIPKDRFFASPRAYELVGLPVDTTYVGGNGYRIHMKCMLPEDFARWESAREELFAGTGDRLAMEVRYLVHGETRWHSLQAICRRDDAGKVIRWTGSATDITERKTTEAVLGAMERKLRQAQRLEAMGTLAAGIAHHFNNIFAAILGFGEIALRGVPAGTRLRRDIESILHAGEQGSVLVDRVLTFSRSCGGARIPIHVQKLVSEALERLADGLPAGIQILSNLTAGRAATLGDAAQLHQVVMNLATNAIQAMPRGGTLEVSLTLMRLEAERPTTVGKVAAAEYIVLEVADCGVGISPAILDTIFEPFFTTRELDGGSGLGLALVHGVVMDLGGAIDVRSRQGAGSVFTVYLPRAGDASEAIESSEHTSRRGNNQRILVVDDEEPLVRLTAERLKALGYEPMGFTSVAAAIEAFHADPDGFDAVVTGDRMPNVSGSTLIREVRRLRPTISIFLMSGYSGRVRQMATSSLTNEGSDRVLREPTAESDLATSLARIFWQ